MIKPERRDERTGSVGVLAFLSCFFLFFFSKNGKILSKSLKIVVPDTLG